MSTMDQISSLFLERGKKPSLTFTKAGAGMKALMAGLCLFAGAAQAGNQMPIYGSAEVLDKIAAAGEVSTRPVIVLTAQDLAEAQTSQDILKVINRLVPTPFDEDQMSTSTLEGLEMAYKADSPFMFSLHAPRYGDDYASVIFIPHYADGKMTQTLSEYSKLPADYIKHVPFSRDDALNDAIFHEYEHTRQNMEPSREIAAAMDAADIPPVVYAAWLELRSDQHSMEHSNFAHDTRIVESLIAPFGGNYQLGMALMSDIDLHDAAEPNLDELQRIEGILTTQHQVQMQIYQRVVDHNEPQWREMEVNDLFFAVNAIQGKWDPDMYFPELRDVITTIGQAFNEDAPMTAQDIIDAQPTPQARQLTDSYLASAVMLEEVLQEAQMGHSVTAPVVEAVTHAAKSLLQDGSIDIQSIEGEYISTAWNLIRSWAPELARAPDASQTAESVNIAEAKPQYTSAPTTLQQAPSRRPGQKI